MTSAWSSTLAKKASQLMLAISVSVLCYVFPASAQLTTGSMVGSVTDQSGAALPGVSITAVKNETGTSRATTTNAQGDFVFNSMDPGSYTLTFEAKGFQAKRLANLILTTGETLPVSHVSLQVGSVTQVAVVSADSDTVATQSSEVSDLLSSRQIEDLVVRGRNFTDLVTLTPGVIDTTQSQDISTGSNPAIYVNGNRDNSNSIFVDGVPADDMSSTQMKDMVSQDAVSEVKIETTNYDAEYGRQSGSNIVAVTKSGTRDFHGMAQYFNRNEDYNANNYFNNLNKLARPIYRYNTVTYNVGGPVSIPHLLNRSREKLFFFWNQEFWPSKISDTGDATVPTALERQGNFSQSYNPAGALYTVTNPYNGGAAFSNNEIPTALQSSSGEALLNIFPTPNFSNLAVSKGEYNYVYQFGIPEPVQTETLRIDYNINQRDSISGTNNDYHEDQTGPLGVSASSGNVPIETLTYFTAYHAASGQWRHIFTPSMLNVASFGFDYQPANQLYTTSQLDLVLRSKVGFTVGQLFPSANPLGIVPDASFGGIPNDGTISFDGRFPLYNKYYMYNYTDNFSYVRGTHDLKAGFYAEYYTRTQVTQNGGAPFGSFSFANDANNPLNTGYAYADAALGTFDTYSERSIRGLFTLRDTDFEWYVQDNWRLTPKLTLNYGLRFYDVAPFYEANNQVSAFVPSTYSTANAVVLIKPEIVSGKRIGVDPGTGTQYPAADIGDISPSVGNPADGMVAATNPGSSPRSLTPGAGLQLGPRLGFAYDAFGNGKTAVRGGIGVFQNRVTENYFDDYVGLPPLAETPTLYYGQLSTLTTSAGLVSPGTAYGVAAHGHLARVVNYSFGIQQDVGFSTILSLAYVGSVGRHLSSFVDQNAIPMGADFLAANQDPTEPGKPLPSSFYRPIVGYNAIDDLSNETNSSYNSLQLSLERRFGSRIQYGAAYTWSKTLDYTNGDTNVFEPVVPMRAYYYSLASFDVPQVLVVNFVYNLPKSPWKDAISNTILSNWVLSDISTFQTGLPSTVTFTTTTGEDITGTTSISPKPVITGNPNLSRGNRTFHDYFNTSVFQLPAVGTYGSPAQANNIIGPGINDFALGLLKNIPIHESIALQLRFEAYNAFNHTQFSTIDTAAEFNSTTGAQINGEFGQVTAARDPRELQLSGRISF